MTQCPACGSEQKAIPRYPNYVCRSCAQNPQDEEGRSLSIVNANTEDGLSITYAATKEERASRIVFIRGVRCRAKDAHFGGVVIQPTEA